MNNIGIIITTFNRDNLLEQTITNIKSYAPKNSIILIGDQNPTKEKELKYEDTNVFYYSLPNDCGLSYSRNFLINEAYEFSCPYILMMADSIQFSDKYNFIPLINILNTDSKLGIIGFDLVGSKCCWEFLLDLKDDGFYLNSSNNFIEQNNIKFKIVDICRNIFLAKTDSLLNLWDNEMKLAEHELAFWNYKKRGFKVYWTDMIKFKKITNQNNNDYNLSRKRFNYYRELLKKKLHVSGWVSYSSAAMREIRDYKLNNHE